MSDLKFTKIFPLSREYNIVNGFTFVLHDHMKYLALLSLIIANKEQRDPESRLLTEQGILQILLIDINEQMYRLARTASSAENRRRGNKDKPIFSGVRTRYCTGSV